MATFFAPRMEIEDDLVIDPMDGNSEEDHWLFSLQEEIISELLPLIIEYQVPIDPHEKTDNPGGLYSGKNLQLVDKQKDGTEDALSDKGMSVERK